MNDVMLDIETIGKGSNAAIASIGAVMFNPFTGEIGTTFYKEIDIENAARYGMIDAATIKWWMRQSDAARAVFNSNDSWTIPVTLEAFAQWLRQQCDFTKRIVWGNGATFDNVILSNAYKSAGLKQPWPYFGDRDVRTVVDIGRRVFNIDPKKNIALKGTAHNALDDAIHQAKYVSEIYRHLNGDNKAAA